ncbi:UNVERIFIED_CONTAM: hypothetical protein HDU68_005254 [Siphonaria sp. JEL0065]|nr:hypothetical protein HDU68_005254 [Siphonaria sp. JEL0065]
MNHLEPEEEALVGDSKIAYALAKLLAGIASTPIDLVNLLRMVEYRPSESLTVEKGKAAQHEDQDQEEEPEEHGDDSDEDVSDDGTEVPPDAYEYATGTKADFYTESDLESMNESTALLKNTDAQGYLLRSGGNDENDPTRPPFEISVDGLSTFQGISKIVKCESEGFFSLWNGHLISWFHEMTHSLLIQPSIEQFLNDQFNILDDAVPYQHLDNPVPALATLIGSHALSGIILSPMELIRTRIMVQTSNPYHRKYKNSCRAFSQILREEGPGAFYMSRRMFPTILLKTLQPIFKYGTPFFVQRILDLDPEYRPLSYQIAELGMQFVELLVVLPLETVVRRLECQVVGRFVGGVISESSEDGEGEKSGSFEGMVRCNAIPYTGMFNCASRVILEEGGSNGPVSESTSDKKDSRRRNSSKDRKKKSSGKKAAGGWFAPVSGLYRGLKLRMYVNLTVAVLRVVSSASD